MNQLRARDAKLKERKVLRNGKRKILTNIESGQDKLITSRTSDKANNKKERFFKEME